MSHVNRKQYFQIFAFLTILTVLEIAVAVPHFAIPVGLKASALIALAVAKATLVGLFYMHLKHETKILKLSIAIPLAMPAVYAAVLIAEAAWRMVVAGRLVA